MTSLFATVVLGVVVARTNIGPTPQMATLHEFGDPAGHQVRIVRTNVSRTFAVVSSRGATMEGQPLTDPILLEHFSFGWQPVQVLSDPCVLAGIITSARERARLMRGIPEPHAAGVCNFRAVGDSGSRHDVDAIRRRMTDAPLVPYVAVAGRFALASWYGAGGGETLWKRRGADWTLLTGGGGALGKYGMRQYGVPQSAWCAFGIYDAPCPNATR